MQTKPSGLTPEQRTKIIRFLQAHPVGVLATVDAAGDPNASVIYISVNDELRIRFTTKQGTRKYQNIAGHPKVVLAIYEALDQSVVQVVGRAVKVENDDAARDTYKGTLHAAGQTGADIVPPIAKIPAGPYAAFEIEVEDIWMTEYGWGDSFSRVMQHAGDEESNADPA